MRCTRARDIDLAEFAVDPHAAAWTEFRDHYPICPDCSRAVGDFAALKAALGSPDGAGAAHASEAELIALASPSSHLAPNERARLETHLANCPACRTELAVLQRFDFAAVSAARPRARDRRATARWWPALAAAVIAVIAIPVAVLLSRPARETPPVSPAPVAKVEPGPPAAPPEVAPSPAPPEPELTTLPAPPQLPALPARPAPAVVAEETTEPAEPPGAIQIAALVPAEPPLYAPGALAAGPSVRVGDATRNAAAEIAPPLALSPAQVGATSHGSPSLYWFLSDPTPLSVEVTIVDPSASEPLLEAMLPGPHEAGVHRLDLAARAVQLRSGVDYRWFVALVRNPERRSQDVVSGGAIRYAPPTGEIAARLSAPAPGSAAHLYAESGYWYDAFDQLCSWITAEPEAARLHAHRAALLDQVGLTDAAAFERSR